MMATPKQMAAETMRNPQSELHPDFNRFMGDWQAERGQIPQPGRYTAITGDRGTGYGLRLGQNPPKRGSILAPEEQARRQRLKAMASRRNRGRAYTTAMMSRRANTMYNTMAADPNDMLG